MLQLLGCFSLYLMYVERKCVNFSLRNPTLFVRVNLEGFPACPFSLSPQDGGKLQRLYLDGFFLVVKKK